MTNDERLSAAKAEYTGQLRETGNVSFSIWLLNRAEAAEVRAETKSICCMCGHDRSEHDSDGDERIDKSWCNGDDAKCDCIHFTDCANLLDALEATEARAVKLEEKLRLEKIESQSAWDNVEQWTAAANRIASERDELRAKLEQAQQALKYISETDKDNFMRHTFREIYNRAKQAMTA